MAKKTETGMSEEERQKVLSAHTKVNAIVARIEGEQPGPSGLRVLCEELKAAVEPLAALVADEPEQSTEGQGTE